MTVTSFGTADGQPVHEVTIRSAAGAQARILTYGALVRDFTVKLAKGGEQRVVLGLDRMEDYLAHSPSFGITAGRYANRIAHGRFSIDGDHYQLDRNQAGLHTLHGGSKGFGKRVWQLAHADDNSVTLTLVSPDGDMGFPGTMTVTTRYSLVHTATLRVEMTAVADAPTLVNLAHHSYWNLDGSADVLDHDMQIAAAFYTPVDADLITTGEIAPVAGTPFDFRTPRPIRFPGQDGPFPYDHNWVLAGARPAPGGLRHALSLRSRKSGLEMEVHTTEPGIQVYTGSKLNVPVAGLGGARYGAFGGVAIEPQVFPDSPNKPHFPDPVLRPGHVYRQLSEYRLS
ncbi:galactose mutarotase [Alsobacter sp. SYSU M60028]|uniref:Aldose 1-epimerase n=1 Tax=Alsobacter ponti TaxID=2962936 RepID=A0ABT1L9S9_9HYPH|nr:aldose epimerase family protein [Alsobacter ponti]MCP8937716.1 galactose mutarotase [Alsobacter ponti]